jgi:SAM-dependent methyltransferase
VTDFDAFERTGWDERADGYDRFFPAITDRLIEPLLDAAGVGPGTRLLDVGSGPGHLAARAAARGAEVTGADVAPGMLALARRENPGLDFQEADVHALPFPDAAFTAVTGNFILPHLGHPEQAAAELVRVLAPGGRLALTMWDAPQRARFIGVLLEAVAEVGAAPPADLPEGPPFFRFSADAELDALLHALDGRTIETIAFRHPVADGDELWDGLLGGTVRTAPLILRQPEDVQRAIRAAFDRRMAEEGLEPAVSVRLASGRKP